MTITMTMTLALTMTMSPTMTVTVTAPSTTVTTLHRADCCFSVEVCYDWCVADVLVVDVAMIVLLLMLLCLVSKFAMIVLLLFCCFGCYDCLLLFYCFVVVLLFVFLFCCCFIVLFCVCFHMRLCSGTFAVCLGLQKPLPARTTTRRHAALVFSRLLLAWSLFKTLSCCTYTCCVFLNSANQTTNTSK